MRDTKGTDLELFLDGENASFVIFSRVGVDFMRILGKRRTNINKLPQSNRVNQVRL
jgi:hypothetical protein